MATRTHSSRTASKRGGWEYRVVKLLDRSGLGEEAWQDQCGAELSKLGAEGWELCAQTASGHLVLKRER